MMKITSSGMARTKLRLNTTPDDLRIIANRLEEITKSANYNQTAEVDVSSEPFIITFEYYPTKISAVSTTGLIESRTLSTTDFGSEELLVN